ncbi:MAG: T9SS type A sorting domain-containing protein [Vicingaceae bacterium]|nr:T9SS type A sorting domain-containing protein [Vicingaceae bacterium]
MKKLLLFITLIGLGVHTLAQNFAWAKSMRGINGGAGRSIAVDAAGNAYTTGAFTGTVDFDPGTGIFNLTSAGGGDIFVSKLDASGNFVWARNMGGTSIAHGYGIALDAVGNVYTTGYFQGTVDFDPGAGTFNLTVAGNTDIFVSKLDASGNFVWAKNMGGVSNAYGYSIAVDVAGNIYTTGVFEGIADFDPGAGTVNLTSAGSRDIFVSKLDASGNFLWAKNMGGTDFDEGNSIAVDTAGNVYTTGYFYGTADFDPGAGIFNLTSTGGADIFTAKLDASGNFVWAKNMGGIGSDEGRNIAVDAAGNVYTTGGFLSSIADFDPGAGTVNLTSAGNYDIFVSKLDASGNFMWAKSMGGTNNDFGNSIAVDVAENVYTTGFFEGIADFDPGAGTVNLTSAGSFDVFVSKLDASGNFMWAKSMGGTVMDGVYGIALDTTRSVYTTGYFRGTADFDPGTGIFNLTSASGDANIFVSKLSCPSVATDIQSACDSLTWIDGITYFSSTSTPTFTLTNTENCDSVITLILTINNPNSSTDLVSACDSITWIDGNTYYTNTNTPTFTLTNIYGCDSVVTLNLTINNPNSSTDLVTACDSITWIDGNTYSANTNTPTFTLTNVSGCDSVVTLNLTINNSNTGTDVQTACNNLTWIDNITYTSSTNTPTFTIVGAAANGCDSVVTLDLTLTTIDNTTSLNTDTISANQNGATYRWLNCDSNNVVIAGATAQNFTPTATGNYAVEITVGSCVDTSACVNVIITGIEELTPTGIKIYPNPFDDNIVIEFGDNPSPSGRLGGASVTVVNIEGKVVYSNAAVNSNKLTIDAAAWSKGVYFVTVINDITSTTLKLIKE